MAYTDAQIKLQEIPIGGGQVRVVGINPRTGQQEAVLRAYGAPDESGNAQATYYFKGDSDVPANAQEAFGTPHVSDWGSKFDNFMGDVGVPAGLMALAGAGALSGAGLIGADAAGSAAAGGSTGLTTGGAAAAGGGDAVLGSGLTTGGTGLTAGSTGAGGITGSLAGTTYAGESLYPVIGGQTAAALGGGATTGGVLGTGITAGQLGTLAGSVIPAALGVYGSNEMGNTLHDITQTNRNDTLPYLTASQGWLANPASYYTGAHSPGMTAINGALRGLSVTGNPFGSPGKIEMAADAGMRSWLAATGQIGQLGLSGQNTNANLAVQGAQTDAQGLNSIGWGVGNYFNPQPNFNDFYKRYLQNGVT